MRGRGGVEGRGGGILIQLVEEAIVFMTITDINAYEVSLDFLLSKQ